MFKNEFKTKDILKLWDVMFSQHNTGHFEIFVGTSIILMHKEQVNVTQFRICCLVSYFGYQCSAIICCFVSYFGDQ